MRGLLLRLTKARPTELGAVLAAFVLFFTLLAAYYVLRPVRDEMAIQIGPGGLQRLFDAVFVTMLAAVPAFGWLVRRFPRRQVLPWLYGFFVLNLVGFFALMSVETQRPLVAKSFFVWVTVFSVTGVSVFWSLMADLFTTAQAKRVYGFIAAGGTAGAIMGPALTVASVSFLGPRRMLLVAAALLTGTIAATAWLKHAVETARRDGEHEPAPEEGAATFAPPPDNVTSSVWSGIRDILRSPLLLGICGFLLLFSLLSTFLYFETTELMRARFSSSTERTALLAKVDGAVSVLALLLQIWIFPRAVARLGVRVVLVALPLLSIAGFAAIASWPTLSTILIFGVLRRAGEYAISKPAREMLYNALTPDEKYKAKNVIDTLVYRSGDELSSRLFTALRGLGFTTHHIAWLAVPLSALWAWTAWWLGHPKRVLTPALAPRSAQPAGSPPRKDEGT